MEYGTVILFELGNYTIYTDVENVIILTFSLVMQGLLLFRILFSSRTDWSSSLPH